MGPSRAESLEFWEERHKCFEGWCKPTDHLDEDELEEMADAATDCKVERRRDQWAERSPKSSSEITDLDDCFDSDVSSVSEDELDEFTAHAHSNTFQAHMSRAHEWLHCVDQSADWYKFAVAAQTPKLSFKALDEVGNTLSLIHI